MISYSDPEVVCVPSFIAKLWDMVNDTSLDNIISWSKKEDSFIVKNKEKFTVQVIPKYFKHSNFSSFIRQLNKYGFKKVHHFDHQNGLEFAHNYFLKSNPELLLKIKRKQTEAKHLDNFDSEDAYLKDLFQKVQQLKNAQDNFEADVELMEDESNALRSEMIELKRKQRFQQQVVNKIMAFLANVMAHSEKDHNNVSLSFSKNALTGFKNLIAITEKPHTTETENLFLLQENQKDEDITRSESVTSSEDFSEKEFINPLSPSVISTLLSDSKHVEINENNTPLPGDSSSSSNCDEAFASPSLDLSGHQSFNASSPQNSKSNDCTSFLLKSPIIINVDDCQNLTNNDGNFLENGDFFNSNDIVIFDPLESNENMPALESTEKSIKNEEKRDLYPVESYEMASACTDTLPSKSMNEDLGNHVTMMESNLNSLKELMHDVDLSLDENEVEQLFSAEEFASIMAPDDDVTIISENPAITTALPVDKVFDDYETTIPVVSPLVVMPLEEGLWDTKQS